MNHDLDVLSRLVDYHDHVSAPSVPLVADLERGRRRVRRIHRLLGTAVAVGLVSVGAAVSLLIGARSAGDSQPAGPTTPATTTPAPDGLGLTTPLVAPTSVRDVSALGFHVAPVPGFDPQGVGAGWSIDDDGQTVTLWWNEVADEVDVTVLYQGESPPLDPSVWGHAEEVTVHGVAGHYVERPGGPYNIDGAFDAALAWEFAPESWAYVWTRSDRGDPGPERLRSGLMDVADAVAAGGDPARVPVHTGPFPPSMPALSAFSGVGVHMGRNGWETTMAFDRMRIMAGPGKASEACARFDGGTETFTYRGHAGCLKGEGSTDQPPEGTSFNFVNALALQTGDIVRTVIPSVRTGEGPEYPIKDLKQAIAQLTVAPLEDPSTWFELKAAIDN